MKLNRKIVNSSDILPFGIPDLNVANRTSLTIPNLEKSCSTSSLVVELANPVIRRKENEITMFEKGEPKTNL